MMAVAMRLQTSTGRLIWFPTVQKILLATGVRPVNCWHAHTQLCCLLAQRAYAAAGSEAVEEKPLAGKPAVPYLGHPIRREDACEPKSIDILQLQKLIAEARMLQTVSQKSRSGVRTPSDAGEWRCGDCGQLFPIDGFHPRSALSCAVQSCCRGCRAKRSRAYFRTLRGCVRCLISSARRRSKQHGRPCTLVPDDILGMLWRQKGRCSYSGVAMEILLPHSHWRMSLERKVNTKGYCSENCILIAAEFNTSDYSRHPGVDASMVSGTAQWSEGKVRHVLAARSFNLDLQALLSDIEEAQAKPRRHAQSRRHRRLQNADG
ncbi:unnamed protein product [Polarella glacialis]|uniref:Uncharacterized protein n=1 Tax=Polarella glacialis TaxID=89957 RepID=A0A813FBN7_POLGL|nr:unnamed protein product [Polarella glacialis]